MKNALTISCLFLSLFSFAQTSKPASVIFDTDMGPDYDDVGAITLLHAFADSGRANILATMASTKYEGVAAVINVLNTYFKRADIPIGVPKGNASELRDFQHWTDTLIAKYPHAIKQNSDAEDAVALYRKILSQQPDGSVTVITTGFLTNLSNLLKSKPDSFSKLSGRELVKEKVKYLVCMAGKFPKGSEFNIRIDADASRYTFENWETPIVFSGWEIGIKIRSGLALIHNNEIQNSPVKDVFRICIPMSPDDNLGRYSWDQTAVFVGVFGYKPYYKLRPGTIAVYGDGSNSWLNKGNKQFYLAEDRSPSEVQELINYFMMHQPRP